MRRKLLKRRTLASIIMLVIVLVFPAVALAANISVTADSTAVEVGDTVALTIEVSAKNIAVADGVFTYDPAKLTYLSSNGGASDGYINLVSVQEGGSSSLTAVIKFAAIGEGEAVIDVSLESILNYDGETLGDANAGVSIAIESSGISEDDSGTNEIPIDLSQTGVAAHNVMDTDEQMYIWRSLRNVSLPSGFVDYQVTYNDEYVGGTTITDSEDFILLYLSEVNGENAGYYIYDELKDALFPYTTVTSISARFTILWPYEDIVVPSGFNQTTIVVDDKDVPAWQKQEDTPIYLVYVRNSSGELGFYLYNKEDRSLQRYHEFAEAEPEPMQQPVSTPEPTDKPVIPDTADDEPAQETLSVVSIALIAVCAFLAILSIVMAVLYRRSVARLKRQRTVRVKNADL